MIFLFNFGTKFSRKSFSNSQQMRRTHFGVGFTVTSIAPTTGSPWTAGSTKAEVFCAGALCTGAQVEKKYRGEENGGSQADLRVRFYGFETQILILGV